MKSIWMLAAAATLAACAGRGEDEMGAAPDRGDTTAVTTGADTTQWDTTTGVGETAEPGMVPDTATQQYPEDQTGYPADTTMGETGGYPADTTMDQTGGYPADTTMDQTGDYGQDTSATGGYDTTPGYDTTTTGIDTTTGVTPTDPGMTVDTAGTTGMGEDSANVDHTPGEWQGDSALTDHNVPTTDTTQAQ